MKIEDGRTGRTVEVNDYSQMMVEAAAKSAFAKASERGDAFSWTAVSADIDAGDTALLVCNDSQERKLRITQVYGWCDVAQQFKVHVPAYPTLAGTAVVGVCLNRKLLKTAPATAKADETGNTFAAANTILTMRNNEVGTDQFECKFDFEGALILGYHDSVAIDLVAEPGAFECSIYGYFED